MDTNNAYRVLGLAPGASEDEVKAAYRALAQQYAPEAKPEGPERKEAEARRAELNEAFDTLISVLRTGVTHTQQAAQGSPDRAAAYRAIRQMIDSGNVDGALAQLGAMTGGANDAEWNFLMGSAYYYKGWLAEAMRYFEAACRLAPRPCAILRPPAALRRTTANMRPPCAICRTMRPGLCPATPTAHRAPMARRP